MEKLECLYITGENLRWYNHYGDSLAVFQKVKRVTVGPNTVGLLENWKNVHTENSHVSVYNSIIDK